MLKSLFVTAAVLFSLPAYSQVDLRLGGDRDGGARVHVPDPFRGPRPDTYRGCPEGLHAVFVRGYRGRSHFECTNDRDGYRDHN